MERYIALLRGVNVGGKNKVAMPLLKAAFEAAGFAGVATYINSGNVLFSTTKTAPVELQRQCRALLAEQFQLDIPVAVLPAGDLADALRRAPTWWDRDSGSKHIAIFVIAPESAGAMVEQIGARAEYEQVAHWGQVIFWSAPLKTFSRTRWSKVIATAAYGSITVRNANTTKKLLGLAGE